MIDVVIESVDSDIAIWSIRAFYIFAAYAIIIVAFIPDLKKRFLDYGARSHLSTKNQAVASGLPQWLRIQVDPVLDWLGTLTVPHSWFTHFYICSTACSAAWLLLLSRTMNISNLGTEPKLLIITEQGRALLALGLLQMQGLRRLYECLFVAKPSSSKMWVGHYAIGLAFYIVTNVAVWIEPGKSGQDVCTGTYGLTTATVLMPSASKSAHTSKSITAINLYNSFRVLLSIGLFLYSSRQQHIVHKYLASLKEYKVPDHPIFISTNTVCPHYGAEVNIYLSLAILTAQDTRIFNLTLVCALGFVIINLGVTADLTKQWQLRSFPRQRPQIAGRKRMMALW